MKIAISAVNKNTDSEISSLGGRAPYYLIFNEKGELLESLVNPFADDRGGAGVSTAKMLAKKEVTNVISGDFGGKMLNILENDGIECHENKGVVEDALKDILSKY
ncbi:MAG: NifB/NifX family molybdenum-iron cluster-binding protein [Patescibacteria group bacterium]